MPSTNLSWHPSSVALTDSMSDKPIIYFLCHMFCLKPERRSKCWSSNPSRIAATSMPRIDARFSNYRVDPRPSSCLAYRPRRSKYRSQPQCWFSYTLRFRKRIWQNLCDPHGSICARVDLQPKCLGQGHWPLEGIHGRPIFGLMLRGKSLMFSR